MGCPWRDTVSLKVIPTPQRGSEASNYGVLLIIFRGADLAGEVSRCRQTIFTAPQRRTIENKIVCSLPLWRKPLSGWRCCCCFFPTWVSLWEPMMTQSTQLASCNVCVGFFFQRRFLFTRMFTVVPTHVGGSSLAMPRVLWTLPVSFFLSGTPHFRHLLFYSFLPINKCSLLFTQAGRVPVLLCYRHSEFPPSTLEFRMVLFPFPM